ncbi:MAG: hypothetical protein DYG89_16460 [Caldilinea sp. CFX5]|nr:hypothetical protein [Caldilinea sp. CFX5]
MTIELAPGEQKYLYHLVETALGDLRQEIHHTETLTFKEELKERETMVRDLLAKLKAARNY